MRNTPITDELARQFAGKRLSSREAGSVWSLCRVLERELAEVTEQRDTLSEALTEIEQYNPISENRFAIKSEFYWLAHKALSAVKGGSDE
jgi:hypothetical protein